MTDEHIFNYQFFNKTKILPKFGYQTSIHGRDIGFYRGGGFSKTLPTFCFLRPTKKQAEKGVLGTFWKTLTKKSHFFSALPPQSMNELALFKNFSFRQPQMDILK